MSKTIRNFIVGIGYDYDSKGEKKIGSGIDSIKSKAMQAGAVIAGAFGIKALTTDFAQSNDELGKFAEAMDLDTKTVAALGDALRHSGGSLQGMMSQLQQLAEMRAGLLTGDIGWISAVNKAGIEDHIITDADNATDAYFALADAFKNMSAEGRINAAQSLGLDQASILLLSEGRDKVESIVAEMIKIRPHTDEMASSAAEFNNNLQDAVSNIGRIADEISRQLLPVINEALNGFNDWFADEGDSYINKATNFFTGEEGQETMLTGGVAAGAALLGAPAMPILAGAAAVELWDWNADDVKEASGIELPAWMFQPLDELFTGGDDKGDESSGSGIYDDRNDEPSHMFGGDISETMQSRPDQFQVDMSELFTTDHNTSVRDNTKTPQVQPPPPPRIMQPIRVEASFNLDGRVIDQKIIEVNERTNKDTMADLESSIRG